MAALLLVAVLVGACRQTPSQRAAARPPSTPVAHSISYVAIGASDAFGIGTDDPDRENWPTVLAGQLGPSVRLVNLGIPGVTLAQATENELPVALDAHPDVVTVWLAANDIADGVPADQYGRQLDSMLARLRGGTDARIYVANLPDVTLLPFFQMADDGGLRDRVAAYNRVIAAACQANGAYLVDLWSQWREIAQHPEYIAGDGLHPTAVGAQRLAEQFYAAIAADQNRPVGVAGRT